MILAALAVVCDGYSNQLIGFAIPAIMRDWHAPRSDFGPVLALGLIGMTVGSVVGGRIGDLAGRRPALIGSVFLFGVATLASSFTHTVTMLALCRFLSGLGLGGSLPAASTLIAEVTPRKNRGLAVVLTIVCMPLGGMLAGIVASQILPSAGWKSLFLSGGIAPIALSLVLFFVLPESPYFLVRYPGRRIELIDFLRRSGHHMPDDATFDEVRPQSQRSGASIASLFGPGLTRDTIALWCSFFSCLLAVYLVFSWLPTMLIAQGMSLKAASSALAAYNFGGVLGALCFGALVGSFGSRRLMLSTAFGGAVSALLLVGIGISTHGTQPLLILGIGVHGFFVNATQTALFALAAHVYTADIRATGSAFAIAFGRTGAIMVAYVGSGVIQFGRPAYLEVLAIAMVFAFAALATVRNHIAPAAGNA